MFKIYKYLNLRKHETMPGQFRFVCNKSEKIRPIYRCKQPEKEEEIDYEKEAKDEIERILKCPEVNTKMWRNIFVFICIPVILGFAIKTFLISPETMKRPKFKEYEHLRIRKKPFPWDPVRTFFHNPRRNALPTGYEIDVPEDEEYEP